MKELERIRDYIQCRLNAIGPGSAEINRLRRLLKGIEPSQQARTETPVGRLFNHHIDMRLNEVARQLQQLKSGKLTFDSTETWRSVYEEVLNSVRSKRYLSVALIRSEGYWQDKPAQESLKLNYRLMDHGFSVQRIFIVDDFFWAPTSTRPVANIYDWMFKQYLKNIQVAVLRLSDLKNEQSLAVDFGIYGDEAVGQQETDFDGKTVKFEIDFNTTAVAAAESRWRQLLLYATCFETILL